MATRFIIDTDDLNDGAPVLHALGEGALWNGWRVPFATADQVRAWSDAFAAWCGEPQTVSVREDGTLVIAREGDDPWEYAPTLWHGTTAYGLDGFVWIEAPAFSRVLDETTMDTDAARRVIEGAMNALGGVDMCDPEPGEPMYIDGIVNALTEILLPTTANGIDLVRAALGVNA